MFGFKESKIQNNIIRLPVFECKMSNFNSRNEPHVSSRGNLKMKMY